MLDPSIWFSKYYVFQSCYYYHCNTWPAHLHHLDLACATTLIWFWKSFSSWLTTFHFHLNVQMLSLKVYLKPFS